MVKPKFLESRIENEIRKTFSDSSIISYKKFNSGLVSPTYKVRIKNPQKILVVKIYKAKNHLLAHTNENVSNYLFKMEFPVPQIYSSTLFKKQEIVVMKYIGGKNALSVYKNSSISKKRKILKNLGILMRKLHVLKIPTQWIHHKHEVKNKKEWINWTKNRIKRYLSFAKENLNLKHYLFLKKEFKNFLSLLRKDLEFVPLHWDYHLDNILVDSQGNISGLFDFDNAMKGHSLADLGQARYWLRFSLKDFQAFEYFLEGYGKSVRDKERTLIRGYCLLHLVAVTRSIWSKKRRLKWIIEEHKNILDELMEIKGT